MLLCPLFDFPIPGSGSRGFRHGRQSPDPEIVGHARENGGNPILDRIFLFFAVLKVTSVRPASRAAGTNVFTDYIRIWLTLFNNTVRRYSKD
jgi:hypothetical protein